MSFWCKYVFLKFRIWGWISTYSAILIFFVYKIWLNIYIFSNKSGEKKVCDWKSAKLYHPKTKFSKIFGSKRFEFLNLILFESVFKSHVGNTGYPVKVYAKTNSSGLDSAQKDFPFKSYSCLKFFGQIYIVKMALFCQIYRTT